MYNKEMDKFFWTWWTRLWTSQKNKSITSSSSSISSPTSSTPLFHYLNNNNNNNLTADKNSLDKNNSTILTTILSKLETNKNIENNKTTTTTIGGTAATRTTSTDEYYLGTNLLTDENLITDLNNFTVYEFNNNNNNNNNINDRNIVEQLSEISFSPSQYHDIDDINNWEQTTTATFSSLHQSLSSSLSSTISSSQLSQLSPTTTTTTTTTTTKTASPSSISSSERSRDGGGVLSTIFDYDIFYNHSDIFNNFSLSTTTQSTNTTITTPIITSLSSSSSSSLSPLSINQSSSTSLTGFDDDVIVDRNSEEFLLGIFLNCSTNASDCCTTAFNNRSLVTTITLSRNDTAGIIGAGIGGGITTTNCTPSDFINGVYDLEAALQLITILGTAAILGLIILATVIGNVFVIAAILLERHLQSVANYLILSLAVADLLVACLVMPLSAVYEVSKEWKLGPELCDMWTSCDVLCCTASILHLVAIALDRYWAVTNIDYIHQRTARRIGVMILIIWGLSFLVSIAPLLGWKDPKWDERVSIELKCMVSQDIGYQIFATASSFYVPLLVILVLYWRIFQTARKRIRRRQQASQTHPEPLANASSLALTAIGFRWKVTATQPTSGGLIATAAGGSGGIAAALVTVIGRPLPTISETTTAFTNISSTHTSPEKGSYGNGVDRTHTTIENDPPTADMSSSAIPTKPIIIRKKTQTSVDSKRERKAAKTLAIITGAFVCCWLPFFILAILLPICQCDISPIAMSFSLWLGYFNSTLNPIIYTIFSPEFRHAFKRILCGKRNSIRRRARCVRR